MSAAVVAGVKVGAELGVRAASMMVAAGADEPVGPRTGAKCL